MNNMTRRAHMRNEKGQTMVEFTLVLPVLLVVLFGIIQFGITFSNYVALTDAVRAGARTAAISRSAADPVGDTKARVINASGDLKTSDVAPTVTTGPLGWTHGEDVTVKATYPYSISLLGIVVASGNLTSSTTERIE
jgi:Flp pilus assembly protein TadG